MANKQGSANIEELTRKIKHLLRTDSLTGAVTLLKSVDPDEAYRVIEKLPDSDQTKLYDLWVASGEKSPAATPAKPKTKTKRGKRATKKADWKEKRTQTIPFFPDHFISEATVMLLIIGILSILTIFFPAGLEEKAHALITPGKIKPEWYFLFLFSTLHYVPEVVGVLAPAVGATFLVFLPFLDRNPEIKPTKRKIAMSVFAFISIGIITLTIIGFLE